MKNQLIKLEMLFLITAVSLLIAIPQIFAGNLECSYDVKAIFEKNKNKGRPLMGIVLGGTHWHDDALNSAAAQATIVRIADDPNCINEVNALLRYLKKFDVKMAKLELNGCLLKGNKPSQECTNEYLEKVSKIISK
jgi:hypothetical protein